MSLLRPTRRGAPTHRSWATAALLLGLLSARAAHAGTTPGKLGADAATLDRTLREYRLHTLDGGTLTLGALRGEVVVVNFWATWCTPCRRELTRLDALNRELEPQKGRVIAISVDLDADNVRRFVQRQRLALCVVHDGPEGLARRLDLSTLPFSMVLDREGHVAFTTLGASDLSVASLAERTRQLAGSRPVVAEGGSR